MNSRSGLDDVMRSRVGDQEKKRPGLVTGPFVCIELSPEGDDGFLLISCSSLPSA
jgi:hypothetical protein